MDNKNVNLKGEDNISSKKRETKKRAGKKSKKMIVLNTIIYILIALLIIVSGMWLYGKYMEHKYRSELDMYPQVSYKLPIKEDINTEVLTNEQASEDYPGEVVGYVEIPAVGMKTPILQSKSESVDVQYDEMYGVGVHDPRSLMPGEEKRSVIAGHREEDFGALQDVKLGDLIIVVIKENTYLYEVTKVQDVATDDEGFNTVFQGINTDSYEGEDETLALYTCYPFPWYSQVTGRFEVEAKRIKEYNNPIDQRT